MRCKRITVFKSLKKLDFRHPSYARTSIKSTKVLLNLLRTLLFLRRTSDILAFLLRNCNYFHLSCSRAEITKSKLITQRIKCGTEGPQGLVLISVCAHSSILFKRKILIINCWKTIIYLKESVLNLRKINYIVSVEDCDQQ